MSCPYHTFFNTVSGAFQRFSANWEIMCDDTLATTSQDDDAFAAAIIALLNLVNEAVLEVDQQETDVAGEAGHAVH